MMKNYILLFLTLVVFIDTISAQNGWQPLFNGKDLNNFEQLNGTATYKIENGELVGISTMNTPNSFLATKATYSDFILEFEVKIENGLNSGVQFRSLSKKDHMNGRVHGYQCEIETGHRKWSGGIYDEGRRMWMYPLSRNAKGRAAFVRGGWNRYRIEAIGNHIQTWVNGVQCTNLVDDMTAEGFIAFQVHSIGDKKQAGKTIRWRNINIKTTDLEEERIPTTTYAPEFSYLKNKLTSHEQRTGWRLLWDGQSAKGWQGATLNGFPNEGWQMDEGVLKVLASEGKDARNGGDIITENTFSSFELSLDFKLTKGANSGIKYFIDPTLLQKEKKAIGLEYQILDDNKHPDAKKGKNGNRTVASLYDLIPAQSYSKGYHKNFKGIKHWNNARIVVRGNHVEHWLNHIKVVEYDRRSQIFNALVDKSKYEPWENFGQQAAGHILLQDHGDEVWFRSIKIRELSN